MGFARKLSKYVAIILMVTMLYVPAFAVSVTDFSDVKVTAWYYAAVRNTVDQGIFYGINDREFGPEVTVTRAMYVQMMANYTGNYRKADMTDSRFYDVSLADWYGSAANWAYLNGIVSGTGNNRFSPAQEITREQAATILYAYALRAGVDSRVTDEYYAGYADADEVSAWAHAAMCWVTENGIILGTAPDRISPKAGLTRAEAAQIFQNALPLLGTSPDIVNEMTYAADTKLEDVHALAKPYQALESLAAQRPAGAAGRSSYAGGYLFDFDPYPHSRYLFTAGKHFDHDSGYPAGGAYPYALCTTAAHLMPELCGLTFSEAIAATDGALHVSYKEKSDDRLWFNGTYYTDHFYYYLAIEGGEAISPDTRVLVVLWSVFS